MSATTPIWWNGKRTRVPWYPPLGDDTYADVCVVGAGIAGVTTAYELARAGKTVVVIDDGGLADGETGRTTAHLTAVLDDRYYALERLHGLHAARLTAESHVAAIDRIEAIVGAEDIECEFERVPGYLLGDSEVLDRELAACHRAGLTDAERIGDTLHFPRQAQFDPVAYVEALGRAIVRDGSRIYGGTHAVEMAGGTTGRVVTDKGHVITAGAVVIATGSPVNDVVTMHTKQAAYRTYVVAMPLTEPIEVALYWDTESPYHYARTLGDMLIVGGGDHKTGQADNAGDRYAAIERWARTQFAGLGAVQYRWSGQILEPVDGLAFIGDLIMCRENPWTKLYDPARLSLRSGVEYARENLNVAGQYARWITPGEVPTVAHIAKGAGAVIRRGITKIAAYRDEKGRMHECSAVCPHLFCIVDWNSTEKTWDCPCHGSRFDRYGKVINGPAVTDLEPLS